MDTQKIYPKIIDNRARVFKNIPKPWNSGYLMANKSTAFRDIRVTSFIYFHIWPKFTSTPTIRLHKVPFIYIRHFTFKTERLFETILHVRTLLNTS
jgi:hypothetical protein